MSVVVLLMFSWLMSFEATDRMGKNTWFELGSLPMQDQPHKNDSTWWMQFQLFHVVLLSTWTAWWVLVCMLGSPFKNNNDLTIKKRYAWISMSLQISRFCDIILIDTFIVLFFLGCCVQNPSCGSTYGNYRRNVQSFLGNKERLGWSPEGQFYPGAMSLALGTRIQSSMSTKDVDEARWWC